MKRIFAALALTGALGACASSSGGSDSDGADVLRSTDTVGIGECDQPLVSEDTGCEDDADDGTTDTDETVDPNQYNGNVSNIGFDTATGEVVIDGLPFDGDNSYTRNAFASDSSALATNSSFDAYTASNGSTTYYALFRRSESGYAQVGASATDRYITFGPTGAGAQRLAGDGALPSSQNSYQFNGEYAAVRTIVDDAADTVVQYVSGTIRLDVDTDDFDGRGEVSGVVQDRVFYDTNGNTLFTTDTSVGGRDQEYISLTDGAIDFDDWTISSASGSAAIVANGALSDPGATGVPADAEGSRQITSGDWSGVFAGPNGEEVAGVLLVEGQGAVGIDESTGQTIILTADNIQEVGTFVARR
ncbi:hypothetical protein [Sagittula sp. SSi028]|uniref:hypothetical protein n=1 Tax=Sagittula sp. SSi028 TaxID=3400636 RepID=UPI003AF6ABCD